MASFELEVPPEQPERDLNIYERVERNLKVVEDRMRGDSWTVIAKRHRLSDRQCRNIVSEYRKANPTLRHHDPVEVVDELLEGYQADIAALNDTYDAALATKNVPARVGAVNARMAARQRVAELLQAIGVLPHDLGTMHLVIDGRITAERVLAVLERHELPDEIFEEMERAFDVESDATPIELEAPAE